VAGCGGKGTSSTARQTTSAPSTETTTTVHRHSTKPAY
jgi:hypothetical protein